jgi:hypothetical protein
MKGIFFQSKYLRRDDRKHSVGQCLCLALCTVICMLSFLQTFAQADKDYDEISVFIKIQGVNTVELPGVVYNEEAYLPITDLFDLLKIKNTPSDNLNIISGFFITQDAEYQIDHNKNEITYRKKVFSIDPSHFIKTPTNLFLKASEFGNIFSLQCVFYFRSLTVTIKTEQELPAVRELRLETMRKNISRMKGEVTADTVIGKRFIVFRPGVFDWSVYSAQKLNGANDTRASFGIGTTLLGGEANLALNLNSYTTFSEKQQYYQWRYVNNDFSALKQIAIGKIQTRSIASIFNPVIGAQLTNSSTIVRKAFGSYVISNITQPGWIVELYVNNNLIDYTKADGTGHFAFNVPLFYGNSNVKLRYYGPYGEEQMHEENVAVPLNFIPPKKLEYTVSGGIVEDDSNSKFGRADLNYGLSKHISIGTGVEYLSSIKSEPEMPFVSMSARLGSSVLLNSEYVYNVGSKNILTFRNPSNWQFDLSYTTYKRGQEAVIYKYLEEQKISISTPVSKNKLYLFSMLTVSRTILPATTYMNAEWMISGTLLGMATRINTYGIFIDDKKYLYSNLSLGFTLPAKIIFNPQMQYDYSNSEIISLKTVFEKRLGPNYILGMVYQRNIKSDINNFGLTFKCNLKFAQTNLSSWANNEVTTLNASAAGSILMDTRTGIVKTSNHSNMGRAGLVLLPYLDLNCDGVRQKDEPRILDLKFKMNASRFEYNMKDTTIRIYELQPYAKYNIELDPLSFDNVSWRPKDKVIRVVAEPNQLKNIEIPIQVLGEVSGYVNIKTGDEEKGQGQVYVCIYKKDSTLITRLLSESDGHYSYMGLAPGSYYAAIDENQLRKLNMVATSEKSVFNIKMDRDGDVVEDVNFVIKEK